MDNSNNSGGTLVGKVIEVNGPLVTVELADVRTGEEVNIGHLN